MKTKIHLISMPWADIRWPSIQLGCLKAYVKQVSKLPVDILTYSPFFAIRYLMSCKERSFLTLDFCGVDEYLYLWLYLRRFLQRKDSTLKNHSERKLLEALNRRNRKLGLKKITESFLNLLEKTTIQYIRQSIAPHLEKKAVNVVGFTTNFDQLYASAYCSRYLLNELGSYKFIFLYGGYSASVNNNAALLKKLGLPGFLVIGEGEKKLDKIIRSILDTPESSMDQLMDSVGKCVPGVLNIQKNCELLEIDPACLKTQLGSLEELPPPDYDDYFNEFRRACADKASFVIFRKQKAILPIEGSRGCFCRCDFCGFNHSWNGFRKMSPESVISNVMALSRKHNIDNIAFVDNVCDTWAEKFADRMIDWRMRCKIYLELRAHHPERFWTKMALAGAHMIQIGVEALSPALLKRIGKGTTVIQNIAGLKYLKELNITSAANLITHHPRSTLEDVRETMQVMRLIPHFDHINTTRFVLADGSPLYNSLTSDEKRKLKSCSIMPFPDFICSYEAHFGYRVPEEMWLDRGVERSWDQFSSWYTKWKNNISGIEGVDLSVQRCGLDRLAITDTRSSKAKELVLEGPRARVYDICHTASTVELIEKKSALGRKAIDEILAELLEKSVLIAVDGFHLSLALRPRDELIQNYYND